MMIPTNNNPDGDVAYTTKRPGLSKKTDLRVIRTRRSLWEALVKLIEVRSIDEITVGEITKNAMVNRATFYRHYEDKADLLERGTAEILADLTERIRPAASAVETDGFETARRGLRAVFDHVADYADFYRIMLGSSSGWQLQKGIYDVVNDFLLSKVSTAPVSDRTSLVPDEVSTRVVTSMIAGLVTWWIEAKEPIPADELIEYYLKLAVLGPYRCLGFDADAASVPAEESF